MNTYGVPLAADQVTPPTVTYNVEAVITSIAVDGVRVIVPPPLYVPEA
jgi:hypothetical protein